LWLSQEFIAKYAQLGALLPLNDALKNVSEFKKDDYYPGAYNIGNYKGDTYFLPWIAQPYVIYLNKDMFAKENVALPTDDWTWDQFIDVAKKFTKDKKYGTVVSMFQLPMLMW
jgi:multiple sugar transport system substrate-binding protein